MSKIYTDLNTVLTPYATAIKKNASDITSLNGSLVDLEEEVVTGRMKNALWDVLKCVAYDEDSPYMSAINSFKNVWNVPAPAIIYKGNQSNLGFQKGVNRTWNDSYQAYANYNAKRFCYLGTDLRTRAGYTYRAVVDYVGSSLKFGIYSYQGNIDSVIENHGTILASADSGWVVLSEVDGIVEITPTVSSMLLFQFEATGNVSASNTYINSITIYEVPPNGN